MIRRYAIEPEALRRWEDFRYIMEKLSFSDGRVLVQIPKNWIRALLDCLGDVGDIERARFVAKLQRYKQDRMITSGMPFSRDVSWVQNAREGEKASLVDAIIVSEETRHGEETFPYPCPLDVDDQFFAAPREIRCLSTAEELVRPATVLLQNSSEALFVDPYFRVLRPKCMQAIAAFAREAWGGQRCLSFRIFTKAEHAPRGGQREIQRAFSQSLGDIVGCGFRVAVHFVDATDARNAFHARYLLTEKGGLRYDKGFELPYPPEHVDVSLIGSELHAQLLEFFSQGAHDFRVEATWSWSWGTPPA